LDVSAKFLAWSDILQLRLETRRFAQDQPRCSSILTSPVWKDELISEAGLGGKKKRTMLNPLEHAICLMSPRRVVPLTPAWQEHIPFGMLLVELLKPVMIVELGTAHGVSYCAFCQAVEHLNLNTRCYAIDTWQGDPHAGYYGPEVLTDLHAHHDPLYGDFSTLIQSTFDGALQHFDDGTIDVLHIDGYHTYEAVKHDFESWLPKLNSRGVVLIHDTSVRHQDFGVTSFWDEKKLRYPNFEFPHCNGLGLLAVGEVHSEELRELLQANEQEATRIRSFFFEIGHGITLRADNEARLRALTKLEAELNLARAKLAENESTIQSLQADHLNLNQELREIRDSFGYKVMRFHGPRIDRLHPAGTSRGVLRKKIVTSLRALTGKKA